MKKNSTTNQSTEEQKKEELKDEIRSYLNDYQSINEDTTITENTKMVLSMLLYTGNGQDKFTIGYRYIEEVTGISKNSISPIVGKLEKKGFINRTKGTRGKNSEYTLNYETMESYVSNCPSVQVSKCTTKKHKKGVQVSKCPSVQPNETTCTPTCTLKNTDIQRIIKQNEEKIQLNKRTNELLEKLCNLYINNNINNNINKNLKDNISSNNNTEGNITREQEKKKNISTGNLEKLKENSKDENSNDEDIPSGMKDSSEDKDNTSKDKLLDNENLNNENNIQSDEKDNSKVESSKDEISNESRIPSDEGNISDNENPSDYPPLDVDGFFENSNSTEYRTNENLNEENENSKENENPSKANENPEDNEMDCSVFGDSNSTDEDNDKDNDKWYESSRSSKSDNHANGMFTNLISELTNNNPKANEISNDNNSKTSENMKKTNNKTNTIPSEGKNPSDENPKANENLNAFGKLQSFRDLKTGRIDGYQFNSYDNLNDSRDYSKSFHASVLCLNLETSDLKASVPDTGTWGMLSRKDGVYSFTASNTDISDCKYIAQQRSLSLEKKGGAAADNENTSNNGTQGDETSKVDNHTTDGEIIAPEQSQIANKTSEDNNDTTADSKDDEKTTETVYADENTDEVDNYTTNEEITAGNSVKMRPEASEYNTNTTADSKEDEKTEKTQSEDTPKTEIPFDGNDTTNNAPQASKNTEVDSNTTNTEEIAPVQLQAANKTYTNPDPNNPKVWEYIKLHLTMKQGSHLMRDVLDEYKEIEAKNIHSVIAYMEDMCKAVRSALEKGLINEMQFNDFKRVFQTLSKGKYNYWRKVFSTRSPKSLMSSEMKMWEILGKPKVVNGDDETSKVDNNKTYEDNVILPSEKDFKTMSLDDIKNHLLTFVAEHPNLSDDKKVYINNLCIAYAIEPQYVA